MWALLLKIPQSVHEFLEEQQDIRCYIVSFIYLIKTKPKFWKCVKN